MAQDQYFDVPQQLRELAERNVEQTRGVYCQIMDAMAQATTLDAIPSNEMTLDLKAVHERAVRFAKQNSEACFAFARELAKARDVQELRR
jgi:putative aminopeptidase FrvX